MKFGSLFSGIEAASVAWPDWQCQWTSEIDPFACAVLAHRYPTVPNLGDITTVEWSKYHGSVDVIIGGSPCQDFSVAGLRAGLAGDRGRLTVEYVRVLAAVRPRWFVWENVQGVLSADDGRAFGIFLGALAECGYGFAYRVLDAQHFGVPQRRRRVFVVGHLGDWRRAAAVLFERESLRGDTAPSRGAKRVAPTLPASGAGVRTASRSSEWVLGVADALANTLQAAPGSKRRNDPTQTLVAYDTTQITSKTNRSNPQPGDPCHTLAGQAHPPLMAFSSLDDGQGAAVDLSPTLRSGNGGVVPAIAFQESQSGFRASETHATIDANYGPRRHHGVVSPNVVRRLTPRECERLQGFPDDYTLIPDPRRQNKPAADQPRYHAIGNSFAVPVITWIGKRIQYIDSLEVS